MSSKDDDLATAASMDVNEQYLKNEGDNVSPGTALDAAEMEDSGALDEESDPHA
jgi:hypothetical protein